VVRAVAGALALGLALATPSLAQRTDPTQPFPKASPPITRFQDDPRVARLEGYLQALADRPVEWGGYPVLVGFFAATFQPHPLSSATPTGSTSSCPPASTPSPPTSFRPLCASPVRRHPPLRPPD